jgi:hypothetical protein
MLAIAMHMLNSAAANFDALALEQKDLTLKQFYKDQSRRIRGIYTAIIGNVQRSKGKEIADLVRTELKDEFRFTAFFTLLLQLTPEDWDESEKELVRIANKRIPELNASVGEPAAEPSQIAIIQPGEEMATDYWVECAVCHGRHKNWAGSTPCCGSIAYLVDADGNASEHLILYGSIS